jgi:hypothetical protein
VSSDALCSCNVCHVYMKLVWEFLQTLASLLKLSAHRFSDSHTLRKDVDEFLSVVPISLDRFVCWNSERTTIDGLRI